MNSARVTEDNHSVKTIQNFLLPREFLLLPTSLWCPVEKLFYFCRLDSIVYVALSKPAEVGNIFRPRSVLKTFGESTVLLIAKLAIKNCVND